MIRRWSCIINLNNNFKSNFHFFKIYKINIFKTSVNFKRFSFKITKFKRKSLVRLKHRSNWMIYTNVIKLWIKDYLFNKGYSRYQFYYKIFINNFIFYNFNFIKNRNENFFYNFNFLFSTFISKNLSYFHNKNSFNLKNSPLTAAWFCKTPSVNTSIIPVFSFWDNIFYPYNAKKNINFDFSTIFEFLSDITIKKNVELRKILILLYYFNLKNFKNVK